MDRGMTDIESRHQAILSRIESAGRVEVRTLARQFRVRPLTVRSDLRDLAQGRLVNRTRGGARWAGPATGHDYARRCRLSAAGKRAIGQLAQALIRCRNLLGLPNKLKIINMLNGAPGKELILAGGSVRQGDGAAAREDAVVFISRYKVDFAEIGALALDADGTVLDHDAREMSVAPAIPRNARRRVLVCDQTKSDRAAPLRTCDAAALDCAATDRAPPPECSEAAMRGATAILVAGAADV